MHKGLVLAFDIGGTKTSWALVNAEGELRATQNFPTHADPAKTVAAIAEIAAGNADIAAVGIGIAATLTPKGEITFATNLPAYAGSDFLAQLTSQLEIPAVLDNDARCALVGEVWKGAAEDSSSVVLLTIGTGIGGAVKQKGVVLPAPSDVGQEISRLVADSSNYFAGTTGPGTVEALIGGKSLEARFGTPLSEIWEKANKHDAEAEEIWITISEYFNTVVQAIYHTYGCKRIIVSGHAAVSFERYMSQVNNPPCEVVVGELGEQAGLVGAARLAWSAYEEHETQKNEGDDWDV